MSIGPANFDKRMRDLAPTSSDFPILGFVSYNMIEPGPTVARIWRTVGAYDNQQRWIGNSTKIIDRDIARHLLTNPPRLDSRAWFCPPPAAHNEIRHSSNILAILEADQTGTIEIIELGHIHKFEVKKVTSHCEQFTCSICKHAFLNDHGD